MSGKFTMVHCLAAALMPAALAFGLVCIGTAGAEANFHPQPRQVALQPAPTVSIDEDVHFVFPAQLGFFVAVGVPYDLFYVQNSYYVCREGRWFRAAGSHGPWVATRYRELPPVLRRHRIERIREYRQAEYDFYRHDRDHYLGKHFITGKDEWKAYRKEEKEQEKQLKHEAKEERKEMKRAEKEERKAEKNERKRHKGDND